MSSGAHAHTVNKSKLTEIWRKSSNRSGLLPAPEIASCINCFSFCSRLGRFISSQCLVQFIPSAPFRLLSLFFQLLPFAVPVQPHQPSVFSDWIAVSFYPIISVFKPSDLQSKLNSFWLEETLPRFAVVMARCWKGWGCILGSKPQNRILQFIL